METITVNDFCLQFKISPRDVKKAINDEKIDHIKSNYVRARRPTPQKRTEIILNDKLNSFLRTRPKRGHNVASF